MIQIKINYEYEIILYLLKKEAHGRELAKGLKTSLTRVQSILTELRNSNVLDYKTQGKNHIYFIKGNLVAKSFILNAENYKLAKLLRKYPFLEPLFKEITERYSDLMIILFGSYAKFIPKEDSDIDLYIETDDKRIKESIQRMNDNLNVKTGKFNKDDLLIQEIVKNHVIIQRGSLFYEKLGFFK
jgi:predicted nucleotidyltransferase